MFTRSGWNSSDGRGLDALLVEELQAVLQAVWWEAYGMRAAIHRLTGVRRCDTAIISGSLHLGPGTAFRVDGEPRLHISGVCPCRDYTTDLLTEADRFLASAGGALRNVPGAVRRHIRTRGAGDWTRRRRTAMGAQARTDRIRDCARARRLPDGLHRAILEYLVDEAGSLAPLDGDHQLHLRLAERTAAEFGGSVADRHVEVLAALPAVEAVCRAGREFRSPDGTTLSWWERYIEQPLGRRIRRSDVEVDALSPRGLEPACAAAERAIDHAVETIANGAGGADARILEALMCVQGPDLRAGVRVAVLALVAREVVGARTADEFVADERRVSAAVALISALRPVVAGEASRLGGQLIGSSTRPT